MLIDSHCHLDFPDFAGDLDGIVARAASAGIGRMVTISTRVRRLGELIEHLGGGGATRTIDHVHDLPFPTAQLRIRFF